MKSKSSTICYGWWCWKCGYPTLSRLADFDGRTLTLDFSDARKLSSSHEFSETRLKQQQILIAAINSVLAIDVEISER